MVRFIILQKKWNEQQQKNVYIPIWLDLLFFDKYRNNLSNNSLHSNMVRFIMRCLF